jgi:ribosome-associated toxin RatA of RatAB toxin-antitoxin module
MVEVTQHVKIEASPELIFKALTTYKNYPKYMLGVRGAKVAKKLDKFTCLVVYQVALFGKDLRYTLQMRESPLKSLTWVLEESELIAHNSGAWEVTKISNKFVELDYHLAFALNFPVPGFLLKSGAKTQVASLVRHFKDYCETGETLAVKAKEL